VLAKSAVKRAFISYSNADEVHAEAVKRVLAEFGIESFLAHEDIAVSEEWRLRIIKELSQAQLFVALLSVSFKASEWAAQELGFAVGRKIPILPLSLDKTIPFGLISHLQGHRLKDGEITIASLADPVARVIPRHVIPILIERLAGAKSFRGAEALMQPLVPLFSLFNEEDVNEFGAVTLDNGQIWDAALCKREYLPEFIRRHRRRIHPEMLRELEEVIADA
jgi:hypothetical protein